MRLVWRVVAASSGGESVLSPANSRSRRLARLADLLAPFFFAAMKENVAWPRRADNLVNGYTVLLGRRIRAQPVASPGVQAASFRFQALGAVEYDWI